MSTRNASRAIAETREQAKANRNAVVSDALSSSTNNSLMMPPPSSSSSSKQLALSTREKLSQNSSGFIEDEPTTNDTHNNNNNNNNNEQQKKADVVFTEVHIREHARRHDGGGAVPEEGYLALGLGWNYEDAEPVPLDQYEAQREQEGRQGTRNLDVIVS